MPKNDAEAYSAKLTGNPFLFFEMKVVSKLKQQGLSDEEIRNKVLEENLFQYETKKSIPKRLGAVLKRLDMVDDLIVNLLAEMQSEPAKLVCFYTIIKSDRLYFEFMTELVREKVMLRQFHLEDADFAVFFAGKAEQSPIIAGFQEYTIQKLRQVYIRIMFDAGLIKDSKSRKIDPPIFPQELRQRLIEIGDHAYIKAMLGD